MTTQGTDHIDIVNHKGADPLALWSPVVGTETSVLMERSLGEDAGRAQVTKQTAAILARCRDPRDQTRGERTGLVVGYVQSGKTLSFTALMAMARDNGFPLVILLAGTKQVLHKQTADRLDRDLQVKRKGGMSPWYLVRNPSPGPEEARVAQFVKDSLEGKIPEKFRRTTVLTVMKNPTRLSTLRDFIANLERHGLPLAQVPVLVVDDEADQAGLNAAVGQDDATATYRAILALRDVLPRHSYVMYTATPQAPLLVNLADALSPEFVSVLTPGPGYTGGEYFFIDHKASFLESMTTSEVERALDVGLVEPPDTLERALATYLLVLAIRGGESQVSMLVHPSHTTELHRKYESFVNNLLQSWRALLDIPGVDRQELVDEQFKPSFEDLAAHVESEMRPLEDLLREVPHWITTIQVKVVNSANPREGEIDWDRAPAWILVGGNKLDRGFTVEGLAVTYMPRSVGTGLADSIQQRARFFGYKQPYADLCRAWLAPETAYAFEHYVEHEQVLRKELLVASDEGVPLKQWTRRMLLDPQFKPCRRGVVDLEYIRGTVPADSWVSIARLGGLGVRGASNISRLRDFYERHQGLVAWDERDPRTGERHNQVLRTDLRSVLDQLLADWEAHIDDRAVLNAVVLLLGAKLDDSPDLPVEVELMDGLKSRERSLRGDGISVNNLQQGRAPMGAYPGDKVFFTDGVVSLQIHNILLKDVPGATPVPGLSLRVPRGLHGSFLVQHGAGQ